MEKLISKWVDYIYYKTKENEVRMLIYDFDSLERNYDYLVRATSKLINLIRIYNVLYEGDKYALLKQRAEQMQKSSLLSLKYIKTQTNGQNKNHGAL